MSSVTNKFRDMQEHPENYTDEHIESMIDYIDKPVDVEEKWSKFEAKHFAVKHVRKTHLWRNVAAIVATVFLIAGGSFATKTVVSKMSVENRVKEIEPYMTNPYKLPNLTPEEYQVAIDVHCGDSIGDKLHSDYKMFSELYSIGCNWYCGGDPKETKASSFLSENGAISCVPGNAKDWNLHTAWVEGAEGQGIGEYLEIVFDKQSNPFNEIHIINGYAKSHRVWEENSRVKDLKVYYNDVPVAILKLKDTRDEQLFKVDMIGPKEGTKAKRDWTVRFEILDVYPGSKYEDTAITEILFDGPRGH